MQKSQICGPLTLTMWSAVNIYFFKNCDSVYFRVSIKMNKKKEVFCPLTFNVNIYGLLVI